MYKIYKHNNGHYIIFLLVKNGRVVSRTYKGWSLGWNGSHELNYEWYPWGGPPGRGFALDKPGVWWNDVQESNELEFLIITGKDFGSTIKRFHIRQKRKQRYWTQKQRKQNESKKEERKKAKRKKAKR